MLDSIQIGTTGLLGYARGLRAIANNTANLDTPGYKAGSVQFADLFYTRSGTSTQPDAEGHGLATTGTRLDFRQGDLRQTGNDFDLGVQGEGFFVLRNAQGEIHYTRAGQFQFDQQGVFVNRADGSKVLGVDARGQRTEIQLQGLQTAPGKATTLARLTGNLSSTVADYSVPSVKIYDSSGEEHMLSLKFTSAQSQTPGAWNVEVLEGSTSVGTGQLVFADGHPTAETAKLVIDYQPAGRQKVAITFDFSSDVSSYAAGTLSTLGLSAQDGHGPGNLTKLGFDASGTLVAEYANGEKVKGTKLLLARFSTPDAVEQVGSNEFAAANGAAWEEGVAGEGAFGQVQSGVLEMSNVDLSREFSDLVVLQRGYQASSQVISTANDMLQELFRMKSK